MNPNKYRISTANAYPENLQIEVSRACSLGCPQCRRTHFASAAGGSANGGAISPTLLEKLDPVLAQVDLMCISGWGESLSTEMVWKLLDIASWQRVNPYLTTNGVLLNDRNCRRMVEQRLGQATISLDAGTPEGYRRLRPGARLEDLVENIHRLARLRDSVGSSSPAIVITFNFHDDSAAEFPPFVRLAATLPIFKAVVHPRYPPQADNTQRIQRLSPEAQAYYAEGLALAETLGVPLLASLQDVLDAQLGRPDPESEGKFFLPTLDEIRANNLFPTCRCAWDFPFIDSEGNVYPCNIYPESFGNLKEHSFEEIWDNEEFIRFRRNLIMQRPSFSCLFCHKTMWYRNTLSETVPEHLSLETDGLVGLGWYGQEKIKRSPFRWSRGKASVFIRNTFKPRLYFVAQALRGTRIHVSIDNRPIGSLAIKPYWDISSIELPPFSQELLHVSFTCPDAQDDPASTNTWCRSRLLGVAVSQIGTCLSEDDEEPRQVLRKIVAHKLPLTTIGSDVGRWMRTLFTP